MAQAFRANIKYCSKDDAIDFQATQKCLGIVLYIAENPLKEECVIRGLKSRVGSSPLIVLGSAPESIAGPLIASAGVSAYLSLCAPKQQFFNTLEFALAGAHEESSLAISLPEQMSAKQDGRKWQGALSPRQFQVLQYIGRGLSNKQIAWQLGLSEATIKIHVGAIKNALNANNRTHCLVIARKTGILDST
jgi:DNA-binding NarL/FixJ family response regulator